MRPFHYNKFRMSLLNTNEHDLKEQVYNAITRMAFERDPASQVKVVHMDYNSLDTYQGAITFEDGLNEIRFRGKKCHGLDKISNRSIK